MDDDLAGHTANDVSGGSPIGTLPSMYHMAMNHTMKSRWTALLVTAGLLAPLLWMPVQSGTGIAAAAPASQSSAAAPPVAAPSAETPDAKPSTVVPVPREQEWWKQRHETIIAKAREGGATLAFLGDSITQGWEGEGAEVWQKHYAPHKALNLGIGGDRTQHVLYRLEHGLLDALAQREQAEKANHLKAIVLMIGTNNSNSNDHTAEDIAAGIVAIVKTLREKLPQTKILLLAIFPRGEQPNPQREKNARASELAAKIADGKMIHYLDIGAKFLGEGGTLSKEIMPDALHLSQRGYEIWADAISGKLNLLLD